MDSLQKFYTKHDIAKECCYRIKKYLEIDYNKDIVVEPSAGNGSFIPFIKKICKNDIFIDIKPEHQDIVKQNYLTWIPPEHRRIHIIGNPPFGFKGSMAIKFIKKSGQFCHSMSIILPLSFAKKSMQHSVPLQFHLIHQWILPENSFQYYGQNVDIPCVFQIWMRKNKLRKEQPTPKPIGYHFVKDSSKADVAIRRVGSNAGKIYIQDLEKRNRNSHYFIKLEDKNKILMIHDIKIRNKNYVSGPCSISKKDIIRRLNKMQNNMNYI